VVYLRGIGGGDPNWYSVDGEVRVHGSVRLIIGLGFGRVIGGEKGRFIVDDRSAPVVKFMHLQAFGGRPPIVENRSATNTLVVESCDLKVLGTGGGDIFVTDCPSGSKCNRPANRSGRGSSIPRATATSAWCGTTAATLGARREARRPRRAFPHRSRRADRDSRLFNYPPDIATTIFAARLRCPRCRLFRAAGVRELSFGNTYPGQSARARGDDVRTEQGGGWIGWALYRGGNTGTADTLTPRSADGRGDSQSLPRLKVSDNQRFLVTADGKPFFWLADTAWQLIHDLDEAETRRYLADRRDKGFTVIQTVALAEHRFDQPNAFGHLPIEPKHPDRPLAKDGPNNDYWDDVERVLRMAGEHQLYVGLLPTWGKYVTTSWQSGLVDGFFTVANAEAYGRFIGARFKDHANLIWILGGDKAAPTDEARAIWRAMARGIAVGLSGREDYAQVLMTYHTSGPGSTAWFLNNEPWMDFHTLQSGHGRWAMNWQRDGGEFRHRHSHGSPSRGLGDRAVARRARRQPILRRRIAFHFHVAGWEGGQGRGIPPGRQRVGGPGLLCASRPVAMAQRGEPSGARWPARHVRGQAIRIARQTAHSPG
jgi:hypothetical protein